MQGMGWGMFWAYRNRDELASRKSRATWDMERGMGILTQRRKDRKTQGKEVNSRYWRKDALESVKGRSHKKKTITTLLGVSWLRGNPQRKE